MTKLTRRMSLLTSTAVIVRPASRPVPGEEVPEAEIIEDVPDLYAGKFNHTRLEAFLKSRGIKPAHLARESGYSRQHVLRIRQGRMEPTRRCIACIVVALRRLSREHVRAADLFDIGG